MKNGRLWPSELAALDLTITGMQSVGTRVGDVHKDDDPRMQMATAVADAHHPFVDLTENDREIIQQIKELAGRLESRTTLSALVEARGQIVAGGR
ncbi:hypothetical protein [Catellatospora tritici]|uniref:hypothetical protein n=1 Tax=Catellatospora tritici TaxID=2851566 RepID=UPI001C2D3548|nr:hypothetical protein [Catellatospora tritici]MBV1855728.1 hypothetical protein [Catellatospora tritici]